MFFRALCTSLIVGPILTLTNQWDAFLGDADAAVIQIVLTFLVPFSVSLCTAWLIGHDEKRRQKMEAQAEILPEPEDTVGVIEMPSQSGIAVADELKADCERQAAKSASLVAEIQNNARKVNTVSKERADMIDGLIAEFAQLRDCLQAMLQSTHHGREGLQEAGDRTRDVMTTSETVADRCGKDAATTEDLSRAVAQFSDNFAEIQTLSQDIASIASRTNLLALNATIEAARAGEAGRGFAVVASEVKQLSVSTEKSVGMINAIVEQMTGSIEQTQTIVENLLAGVRQTADDSRNSAALSGEVGENVQSAIALSQKLCAQMEEHLRSFTGIAAHLDKIKLDTENAIKGSATNIQLSGDALEHLAAIGGQGSAKLSAGSEVGAGL